MHKGFEVIRFENGTTSLMDLEVGQAMHSWIGPEEEARVLYIEQSKLKELLNGQEPGPVVIHDVGLGIAGNALAAIECALSVGGTHRGLTIESFETQLDGIRQALTQPNHFPQLARHFDATSTLLSAGHWRSEDGFIEWRLHPQSYLEAASAARPAQLIYWDFYSPKAVPDLWSERAFKTAYFSGRADAQLFTYSSSSRARVAMLLAGFFVGKGQATSTKSDTTVAAKSADDLQVPLTRSWLQNLRHSPHFDDQILQSLSDHPQFIISHCDVIRHVDAQ